MLKIEQNKLLAHHNSFGIAATSAYWVEYDNDEDLELLLSDEFYQESKKIHIGGGCNILFLANYNGIVVHNAIKEITVVEESPIDITLCVGGGVKWDDFVEYTTKNGLWGAECLSHIPGEVSGATVQNLGAYGAELCDIAEAVEVYDRLSRKKKILKKDECHFSYRMSIFKMYEGENLIVQRTYFRLSKRPRPRLEYRELKNWATTLSHAPSLEEIRQKVIEIRKAKLPEPEDLGNAGSFFMNPILCKEKAVQIINQYPQAPHFPQADGKIKLSAAWLIDQTGLKGHRDGDAGVYEKNALILVNHKHATGTDIARLAEMIQKAVKEKFGVELHPEVRYV